jgi:hypothetical protein
VCLVQQSHRERHTAPGRELAAGVGERTEIIRDVFDIGIGCGVLLGLESEKVDEGSLRTLDLRRDHCLLAHEGVDKPIERGHHLAREFEPTERLLGLAEPVFDLAGNNECRMSGRQIEGNEGLDLLPASDPGFVSPGNAP